MQTRQSTTVVSTKQRKRESKTRERYGTEKETTEGKKGIETLLGQEQRRGGRSEKWRKKREEEEDQRKQRQASKHKEARSRSEEGQ